MSIQGEESIESPEPALSPEALGLPPPRRLLPHQWLPASSGGGGIGLRLDPAPLAPPQLLLIDRGDPSVVAAMPGLAELLAPEERARLVQWRRAEDRERFLLGRAVLRLCLGELLDRAPASLVLATGPRGKPFLADGDGLHPRGVPRFNVAHSGELVLLGFHGAREVGVDVECHRPELGWRPIARRCLPPDEVRRIEAKPPELQAMAFLQAWCALEAGLKARGVGLQGREQVPARPSTREAAMDSIPQLWQVALPAGYAGAAALV